MVGALIWRKGYEYALMALRLVAERIADVRLVIVGDGDDRERIQYVARDLGVSANVDLKGRCDPAGVREVLSKSHIFLHSSLSEGIANVLLESMASCLPVVSTDTGGIREAIDDGIEGYIVAARDTHAMAERLITLALDPTLRKRLGAAARERAMRDFNLTDQGHRFLSLYRQLLVTS
jgi:glycosyltransferase involved in cell wall biosynthesis